MNFELDEFHEGFRKKVAGLARIHAAPYARKRDVQGDFPFEVMENLAEEGLLGISVPKAYKGLGLDPVCLILAIEELARCDGASALTLAAHSLACGHILQMGDEAQKQKFLPAMASGRSLGAWALAEVRSGSDAASLRTRAEKKPGGWVLNGTKMFVTQGSVAGVYIIMARTGPDQDRHGISAFIIEADTPGLRPVARLDKIGCRASDTAVVRLKDVWVPEDSLLGQKGRGLVDALGILDQGRVGIGAMAVGLGQAALEASLAFARRRKQFGRTIASFQAIQWMLADMATEISAARLLVYRAAFLAAQGTLCTMQASMAKLYASEAATRAANKAVQIHGGYGCLRSYPVERYLRDAKICEIGEGTSEIQRLIIARELMKMN